MMKCLSATLVICALLAGAVPAQAITPVYPKQDRKASRLRSALQHLGTGHIRVVLKDGRIFSGMLQSANNYGFAVEDQQRGIINVPYENVTSIKGNNLSTGAKVGVGIGITVGVLWLAQLLGLIPDP